MLETSLLWARPGAAVLREETVSALIRLGGDTAAKHAIAGLTRSVGAEVAPLGIRINAVAPGFIDTARIDELREGDRWERHLRTIPMGRVGTVEETVDLVRYLCGPQSRYVSGQTIYVDGAETRGG